jgi:lactoylglutathione lyase
MSITLGYTIFYVDDVPAAMTFFTQAFGFAVKFQTPEGDYGELASGATTLSFVSNALADSNLAEAGGFERLSPSRPPVGVSITLIAADVSQAFDAALRAGATSYVEPTIKPWGQTVAYVRGPSGMLIELGTPMGPPPSE